jgi:threonine dehydratase
MPVTFDDIQEAAKRIAGHVVQTPCPLSIPLSEATGANIYCKLEYLQRTGSFKERGACNALTLLSSDKKKRGVIAASAGNHALAIAYHAQRLSIPATVVMPTFAPLTKVSNCRKLGANVVLQGSDLAEARIKADELVANQQLTYINGFDDPEIIAGQGTLGLEIAAQVPNVDYVLVPIGGGGLIAGIGLALKNLKPNATIIGIEPQRAASFTAACTAGHPVPVKVRPTLADGLAVAQVGQNAFTIAREFVEKTIVLNEHQIALAILRLVELEKSVVEGAGASSLAACLSGMLPEIKGKNVVLPLTGGNIDTPILGRVLERGMASDGRLYRFTATISDRPGGLAALARIAADTGASILEIMHDRAFAGEDITTVNVHCIVETRDQNHIAELRDRLQKEGFISAAQSSAK